jgi:RNA polymerase sigma-70 factor (ECF subfamily)
MIGMDGGEAADVARARAGDEAAFQGLVERHSRALFRLAYRMTGNEPDAEDVVQEALLKAFRQLDRFEGRSSFGSWLHRIAANCAYDALRRRERDRGRPPSGFDAEETLATLPASDPSLDRLVHGTEVRHRVQVAMARLSSLERSAFVLRHFEQLSTREIGDVLGLETNAVKQCVFRAVRKLREALSLVVAPPRERTETR